ncbi:MAG: hypothetical protein V1874_10110 [Spirochaetota bacterium]
MIFKFKRSFLFLTALSLFVFSIGCSTLEVSVQKASPKLQKDAKIAYFKTPFCDMDLPIFPLIDAGILRSKINDNISKFKEADKTSEGKMADFAIKCIKEKIGNQSVITGTPIDANDFNIMDNINSKIEAKIAEECQKANAAYAYIPISRMKVKNVYNYVGGITYFETKIYVCDKNGKIIGQGYVSTEALLMYSDDLNTYQLLIKNSEPLIKQLIGQMFQ